MSQKITTKLRQFDVEMSTPRLRPPLDQTVLAGEVWAGREPMDQGRVSPLFYLLNLIAATIVLIVGPWRDYIVIFLLVPYPVWFVVWMVRPLRVTFAPNSGAAQELTIWRGRARYPTERLRQANYDHIEGRPTLLSPKREILAALKPLDGESTPERRYRQQVYLDPSLTPEEQIAAIKIIIFKANRTAFAAGM